MTLTNSHSLITKYGSLLLLKIIARCSLALAFRLRSNSISAISQWCVVYNRLHHSTPYSREQAAASYGLYTLIANVWWHTIPFYIERHDTAFWESLILIITQMFTPSKQLDLNGYMILSTSTNASACIVYSERWRYGGMMDGWKEVSKPELCKVEPSRAGPRAVL